MEKVLTQLKQERDELFVHVDRDTNEFIQDMKDTILSFQPMKSLRSPPTSDFISFKDVKHKMQTGDIIFFTGFSPVSVISKTFSSSVYSHLGMVVVLPEFDEPLLWESTIGVNCIDVHDGYCKYGPQLVRLSEKLETYYGNAVWRPLKTERTDQMLALLREFMNEVRGRPYELKDFELVKAFFGTNTKADTESFFCSELLAETYQRLGWLNESMVSNNYLTPFFSHELDFYIKLVGCTLGKEIMLERDWRGVLEKDYLIKHGSSIPRDTFVESIETLEIVLIKAENLTKILKTFVQVDLKDEIPNPYCEFYIGLPPAHAHVLTSKTVKGQSPVWNETFKTKYVEKGWKLKICIKDQKPLADELLGYAIVDLQNLQLNQPRFFLFSFSFLFSFFFFLFSFFFFLFLFSFFQNQNLI